MTEAQQWRALAQQIERYNARTDTPLRYGNFWLCTDGPQNARAGQHREWFRPAVESDGLWWSSTREGDAARIIACGLLAAMAEGRTA